jgi:hypothetical protein
MRNHARAFESTKWPAARFIPCPPKDDDQYRYQDHRQVVKVEFKRCVNPLKAHELINQNHPLFIVKFIGREARHENGEVGNRAQYIEKHLEPPLVSLNNQYAGIAVRLILQEGVTSESGRQFRLGRKPHMNSVTGAGEMMFRDQHAACHTTMVSFDSARMVNP